MELLRFILLISVALISVAMSTKGQTTCARETTINLCDLQERPTEFLNKTFEVRADYFSGFEMGWLKSIQSCELEQPKAILYLFDEEFEKATGKANYNRFERKLKLRSGEAPPRSVRGVFRIRIEPYDKKHEMDRRFDYQFRILAAVAIE